MKRFLLAGAAFAAMTSLSLAQPAGAGQSSTPMMQQGGKAGAAAAAKPMKTPAATKTFVTKATISNMFEIQSSQLATSKAQNDQVKQFAQQMITDHTKAGNDMQAALSSAGMADVMPPSDLDAAHKKQLAGLNGAATGKFDAMYVQEQVAAHKEAVSLFSSYSKSGPAGPLKDFATQTLPTLQQHLQMIQQISATMKPGKAMKGAKS